MISPIPPIPPIREPGNSILDPRFTKNTEASKDPELRALEQIMSLVDAPIGRGCHVAMGWLWLHLSNGFFYPWKLRWARLENHHFQWEIDRLEWWVFHCCVSFSGVYSPQKMLSMMPRIEEIALLTLWWDIFWSRRGVLTTTCEWCVEKDYSDISGNSGFISGDDYVTIYQPSTSPFNLITKCLMLFATILHHPTLARSFFKHQSCRLS